MKKTGLLGIFERISSGQFPQFKFLWTENKETSHDLGTHRTPAAAPEPATQVILKDNSDGVAVGLDVGSSKIVAVIGRLNADHQIEVVGIGEAPSEGLTRG